MTEEQRREWRYYKERCSYQYFKDRPLISVMMHGLSYVPVRRMKHPQINDVRRQLLKTCDPSCLCIVDSGATDMILPTDLHLTDDRGIFAIREALDEDKPKRFRTARTGEGLIGFPLKDGVFLEVTFEGFFVREYVRPYFANNIEVGAIGLDPLLRLYSVLFEKGGFHLLVS